MGQPRLIVVPLTILHVSQPVDGGVAQIVADLLRGQIADGHRVVLACPVGGGAGESRLVAAARAAGAEVRPWAATRGAVPSLRREVAPLRRIVAGTDPHLVHLHSSKAGLAGRLAVRGTRPTVFQPHAWSFAAVTGATAALARGWERWAARWTDRLLCVSAQEQRDGEAAGVRGSWALVPNGLDLDRFDPSRLPEQEQARALLDLDDDGPWAVCVGRLCRQKGQDLLLRAWAGVPARVPGARLALVGEGPDRSVLEAFASRLAHPDSVLFAGQSEDPRDWYAAGDLTVLSSRWEGMALAPLEAMACARPVLLTEVAGARECLPPEWGPPVPVEDVAALREALVARLSDREGCRRDGLRARARVVERHDLRDTRSRVSEVYEEILNGRHDRGRREDMTIAY
jgi:glycosyltransferase involved in cell wall biosynthesis